MNDTQHRTDTVCIYKPVVIGPQKKHWVEFQLLDELGEPLANLPWRAINEAVREGCVPEYSGVTDADGVIRLENLYPLDVTLLMAADPLANALQQRRLRPERPEPERPAPGERTPVYGPVPSGFSPIEKRARADGHVWHYLRIGQLCDRLPTFEPALDAPESPPPYHFPDTTYSGFTARYEELNRRHVLEVCPLRAWSLILHHQTEYSLTNAYNLALMSNLAYSNVAEDLYGSVKYFFHQQCLDLSRTPRVWDGGNQWPCVVKDVPFEERYTVGNLLDTTTAEEPQGDTQLFYAVSSIQVLVAWRGTEINGLTDLVADLTFRPVKSESSSNCHSGVTCPELIKEGKVHSGFLKAFDLAHEVFPDQFLELAELATTRSLFISGHSLGGALALLYAAKLTTRQPLTYTYGMPRTFTIKAIKALGDFTHFRHVNETDTIPSAPFEVDLDNHLYELYGPLGTVLGLTWSIGQTAVAQLVQYGDPYFHHGEIAMFYEVTQHTKIHPPVYQPQGEKFGLSRLSNNTINSRLPVKAKLHIVPTLSPVLDTKIETAHRKLIEGLNEETRARYFPPHCNLKTGSILGIGHHSMRHYTTHLRDNLLEALNGSRDPKLHAQDTREAFTDQMARHSQTAIEEESTRNEFFLDLHLKIKSTVEVTWEEKGGPEGLARFDQLASRQAVYKKSYYQKT
ncbi:MAG: lipase family protein [Pseudomonas sp.]|uniref:lipase family protein n=1 Tax=Pseudomonas sp. TaxID=306 RepID=UPI003D6DD2DA